MTTKTTYAARARRSGAWWAIEAPAVRGAYSQTKRLDQAEAMIREAIALILDVAPDTFDVELVVDLEQADQALVDALEASRRAAEDAQHASAAAAQRAVDELRSKGLPMRDVGVILGVSHQRVAQIAERRR